MPYAAIVHAARDLRYEATRDRDLPAGEVRVRFGGGGICGSDLHYFLHGRNGSFAVVEPLILGHEVAGEIAAINGAASGLAVGDKVAVRPSRVCGTCPACLSGRSNLCSNVFFMGSASKRPHMQGGFAETIDVHIEQCIKVPANVKLEHAACAEPLSIGLHAANRAGDLAGRNVLVIGAGPIGLLLAAVAKQRKAGRVMAVDLEESALERARAIGADATHVAKTALPDAGSYDVVFEASGSPRAVTAAIEAIRRGGIFVQVGNLPGDAFPVPFNDVMAKELDVRGSFRFADEYSQAVALIVSGAIDVRPMISATLPLSRAVDAFNLAADRTRSSKVVLTPG
jgi:L-idonate 5-dehydrogenase